MYNKHKGAVSMKKESFYIDSSNNSYKIFCDLYLPENESIEKNNYCMSWIWRR